MLVQLGLLDASRLPVADRESAAKVLDASLPSNQLIERAAGKAHSQQKKPMENFLVSRADWSSDSRLYWPAPAHLWNGVVDGERFGTGVTVLFYANEEVGKGPKWHVHTYDEIFILQAGRALFTVGDRKIEAKEGDVVFGPAHVPHKFVNLGPGVLKTIDIHVSPRWEQTNLPDPELV